MNENDAIDRSALDRLEEWGGERLLTEMIRLYLENSPDRMEEIRAGMDTGDLDRVKRAAHSLKSSSLNVGAHRVGAISKELEEAAGREDAGASADLRERLEGAWSEACARLREVETGGSA